ncbi:aldolase [Haloferax sp. Atlit-4N]|uniref:HpcH/HpaI aldolase n=1 Tax=Haloferax gibbonsii (strain ATCC 33959 / DSM 4427 / JCM 8863 / NBRC 102184 / NCIMB 2188 / Ma 2.38) TaxID=1227459 RepID=M0HNB4_HALGM|nr:MULTISPECIES: aldolase/citrate lyase family protein [Haloferax]ELZ85192.1 HpcH/HpaI aldolase [Haloferax gibbonsii ATCC 33959]RDZ51086.1 aldolase [Haloferax sp. Atlit-4N]
MPGNSLRERIVDGDSVLGTFQIVNSMMVSEIATVAGFDFVVIDQEHGPATAQSTMRACAGAQSQGGSAVVRVRENAPGEIQRALDVGADGVQVPQVETADDARRAVNAAKFHPVGERGLSPYGRAGTYEGGPEFESTQNEETVLALQVEGVKAVENIDSILDVDGIDVLFLGPYDLSQSLGVPGDVQHEDVVETMRSVVRKAKDSGTVVGTYADTPTQAEKWLETGVQYVTLAEDAPVLRNAFSELAGAVER